MMRQAARVRGRNLERGDRNGQIFPHFEAFVTPEFVRWWSETVRDANRPTELAQVAAS
jgi:hypothetical protein